MAISAKSGWKRHVAFDNKREEKSMVIMISQKEGVHRDSNNHHRDLQEAMLLYDEAPWPWQL